MRYRGRAGFTVIELILIIVVFAGIMAAAFFVSHKHKATKSTQSSTVTVAKDVPLPLKSVGFNLDYYNPATNMAGDMEFTEVDHGLSAHIHQIWQDFGQQDTRTTDTTKKNPQPVYVLPLHTKVHALVTGQIVAVKQLYSHDYTIWTASSPSSHYIYET